MKGMSSTDFGKLSCNGAGKAPGNSPALPRVGLPAQISDAAPSLAVSFKKSRRLIIVPSRYSPFSVGDDDSMTPAGELDGAGPHT